MKIIFFFSAALIFQQTFAQEFSKAIEDNSFFVEEAYNQEEGVIQHIFTNASRSRTAVSDASFTEEWPVVNQTHQASITVPYTSSSAVSGIGDILLNYRYQLTNENNLAISPRFSIILPTGDDLKGLGDGVVGMQFNLPVSRRWSNEFISHFNAGVTVLPDVHKGTTAVTQSTYIIGGSGIYLAGNNFNAMAEILFSTGNGSDELICSPGIRYAVTVGDVQVVPGMAFPFYFTSAGQDNGIFLYLSFEHPY